MHAFSIFSIWFYRNELLAILSGAWFLMPLHPTVALNKSLISYTYIYIMACKALRKENVKELISFMQ